MFDLDHDYHIHTTLSTCCHDPLMTLEKILPICRETGYKEIVITNHFWDAQMPGADDWYGPQNLEHVRSLLPLPSDGQVRLRFGCETEFCGGTKIGISKDSYDCFEWIIVPFNHLHNHFSRPVDCTTTGQVANLYMDHFEDLMAMSLPWKKVGIAHLTCPLTYPGPKLHEVFEQLDAARMRRCFRFLAQQGAGIELNAACFMHGWEEWQETFLAVYRWAKEEGCRFYCGSDAHQLDSLGAIKANLPQVIALLGLTEEQRYHIPEQ